MPLIAGAIAVVALETIDRLASPLAPCVSLFVLVLYTLVCDTCSDASAQRSLIYSAGNYNTDYWAS